MDYNQPGYDPNKPANDPNKPQRNKYGGIAAIVAVIAVLFVVIAIAMKRDSDTTTQTRMDTFDNPAVNSPLQPGTTTDGTFTDVMGGGVQPAPAATPDTGAIGPNRDDENNMRNRDLNDNVPANQVPANQLPPSTNEVDDAPGDANNKNQ